MSRPKDLLDRIALERVVSEGVQPLGKAVPDAKPLDKIPAMGVLATPATTQTQIGATANPRTGVPDVPVEVSITQSETLPGRPARPISLDTVAGRPAGPKPSQGQSGAAASPAVNVTESSAPAGVTQFEQIPGRPAVPNKTEVVAGRTVNPKPQQPMKVGEARVFSPETMAGRVATPRILDTIAGVPAAMKERQSLTGQAQVTPRSQVTVTVPPNFPLNPKEIFSVVDDLIQLPPRQDVSGARDLRVPLSTGDLESTESYVARSFMANEGNTSDLDRWHL